MAPFFAAHRGFAVVAVEIESYALFSSALGSGGPRYRVEASNPLEGGASRWEELAAEWSREEEAGGESGR
ncbi:MAG: hypothetical protein EXQ97_03440 [Alphaproteobacteria bacterium]|nr:hypothetical protein [Alphaproteobacteria bacterium]